MLRDCLLLVFCFASSVIAFKHYRHASDLRKASLLISTYRGAIKAITPLSMSDSKDELDELKVDVTKLSTSEQDRLNMIQKLTKEADELATQAGFDLSSDDDILEKSVDNTNWSGQSTADTIVLSENNWNDVINRFGLAIGDFLALFIFAAIGRSNHDEGLISMYEHSIVKCL